MAQVAEASVHISKGAAHGVRLVSELAVVVNDQSLDLAGGPFQMKEGAYRITPRDTGVRLTLASRYLLRGWRGAALALPVRLVLVLFQRYLLAGIKANAERADE